MCGISGIVNFDSRPVEHSTLERMNAVLAHRGPDANGVWLNKSQDIGFGHQRLSIIDLSEMGAQPMTYHHLTITYNGEIYNYLELRERLRKKGFEFKTDSDTEVIMAAYMAYDTACLEHFDGMFAFVLWDDKKKRLFGARDRFGEKPFYYFKNQQQFVFASEMKAIFASGIPSRINQKMLYYYLVYDVVENKNELESTFYSGVKKMLPGHFFVVLPNGEMNIQKYWDIDVKKRIDIPFEEAKKRYNELFLNAVKLRLRSDVEVGTSLSGGIDSSSVLAAICGLSKKKVNAFTARFNDVDFDEYNYVELLKEQFDFESNCCWVDEQVLPDLDKVFYHQEEPFGSMSILAQWSVMQLAKKHKVPVLLDGQGADETTAGYFKYFIPYLKTLYKQDKSKFDHELKAIQSNLTDTRFLPSDFESGFVANLKQSLKNTLRPYRMKQIAPDLNPDFLHEFKNEPSPFYDSTDLNEFLYAECFNYGLGKLLRFSDRNAMAFSVEVRLPYLSHELVEFLFSLPDQFKMKEGWTKHILRASMESTIPKQIAWRKDKKGFQAPESLLMTKGMNELMHASVETLKTEKILFNPMDKNKWRYIMADKLMKNSFG